MAEKTTKKPIWKRWWAIAIAAVLLIGVGSNLAKGGGDSTDAAVADQAVASQPAGEASQSTGSSSTPKAVKASAETVSAEKKATPVEYVSALVKAKQYSEIMHMSKDGIYSQLTSSYGEQFSKKAAKYAVKHVGADWNANALAKAKEYQDQQAMSPNAIHDQLTSSYGEKFTAKQADYAIKHLND